MKKIVWIFFGILLFLTACNKNAEDMKKEDLDRLKPIVCEAIECIHRQDLESYRLLCDEAVNQAITKELFEKMIQDIKKKGTFQEFKNPVGVIQKDKTTRKEYPTIIQEATYENGKVIYTVVFDENNLITGFFYK